MLGTDSRSGFPFIAERITVKERIINAGVGLLLTGCLVGVPVGASASMPSQSAPSQTSSGVVRNDGLTPGREDGWRGIDWQAVADQARLEGDDRGAGQAPEIRDHLSGVASERPQSRNIWTSLAKKAVIEVLKHSVSKLPAKIRPYANKIVNVVEDIDSFQQTAVVAALTRAGTPYDVSVATAQWIVFFLGL